MVSSTTLWPTRAMSASTTAEAKPCSAVNVTAVLSVPQTSAQVAELPEHSVVHEVENTSVIGPGGDGGGILGDKLSIADFKAVPYFWAAMCCEAKVDGLEVPAQIKEYVNAFFAAVDAAKILKECGGYSIAEYAASRPKLA